MAEETYYSLLEVSETAPAEEIKSAYLRLIREFHPDRLANTPANWQRQAEEKAKRINEAFAMLSKNRLLYDSQLAAGRGLRSTTSGRGASRPPAPSQSSARQGSPAYLRPEYGSRTSASAKQTAGFGSHWHPAASNATAHANVLFQASRQSFASKLTVGERLFSPVAEGLCALGAVGMFWSAASARGGVFCFLLAGMFLFVVALLYERQISRVLTSVGVRRANHQLWATLCMIALVLFAGRAVYSNLRPTVAKVLHLREESTAGTSVPNTGTNALDSKGGVPQVPPEEVGLSSVDRSSIESACLGARLVQGPASYHQCLNTQLEELQRFPNAPDLSGLSRVDRSLIESACSGARLMRGPASYHQCLNTQLQELSRYPSAPDLNRLSNADRASIESACSGGRLMRGPASYRQCLNTQLDELARYPDAPDLSGLNTVDRASIESACSGARLVQGAAFYHRCLKDKLSALGTR